MIFDVGHLLVVNLEGYLFECFLSKAESYALSFNFGG